MPPWGLEIYRRVDPATGISDPLAGVAVDHPRSRSYPTFLYELLWNLLVAALVVGRTGGSGSGTRRAFAVYVAGYTLGRFFIELMRTDPATACSATSGSTCWSRGSSTPARSRTCCWCASHVRCRPSRRAAARLRRPARPRTAEPDEAPEPTAVRQPSGRGG